MDDIGNIKKVRAAHESNFTVMHNEIMFAENAEGERVSYEARGLFITLLSLPKSWQTSYQGLAKIGKCSCNRISKLIHELECFGYLKMVRGQRNTTYILYETINNELWQKEPEKYIDFENEGIDFQKLQNEKIQIEKIQIESIQNESGKIESIQNEKIQNCDNIKYTINKINNKENIKINKTPKNLGEKTCEQNLNNNINLSPCLENKKIEEQEKRGSRPRQGKDENFDPALKNKAMQKEQQPKLSVDDLVDRKIGDNTELENIEARVTKKFNEMKEMADSVQRKDGRKKAIKHRMNDNINSLPMESELKELFRTYIMMVIETKHKMTNETFEAQVEKLHSLSKDIETQKNIVKQSIEKGYCDLYPISNNYKPQSISVKPQPVVQEGWEYELARDENGNILQF